MDSTPAKEISVTWFTVLAYPNPSEVRNVFFHRMCDPSPYY